ncbi:MAG TPA: arginine deiminase family protein [Acidobacteriaceae bacterium]|nr:arginine deiminase family protein [Acidobacteriaceae bacterium]
MFTHAIVRKPGSNFAQGLTTVDLGVPSFELVQQQHAEYCHALRECGLSLIMLEEDPEHPDSTFVEDTAVLTARSAILTRPGAPSRQGEVAAIRSSLRSFFPIVRQIEAPGTVDGGDICEAHGHFFIGLSQRTNEEGAAQLAACLEAEGYSTSVIDVREMNSILHLKSGIAYIGKYTLVLMEEMAGNPLFSGYERIVVVHDESYAANCVRVNDRVLVPAGCPRLASELSRRGFRLLELEMSEFRKMDGGLSCLSLRF